MREQIVGQETKVEEIKFQLDEVTEKLQTEVVEFQQTKPGRIQENIASFANFQVEHLTEMVRIWTELKERLEEQD